MKDTWKYKMNVIFSYFFLSESGIDIADMTREEKVALAVGIGLYGSVN